MVCRMEEVLIKDLAVDMALVPVLEVLNGQLIATYIKTHKMPLIPPLLYS